VQFYARVLFGFIAIQIHQTRSNEQYTVQTRRIYRPWKPLCQGYDEVHNKSAGIPTICITHDWSMMNTTGIYTQLSCASCV
jgi:hypothetical protein